MITTRFAAPPDRSGIADLHVASWQSAYATTFPPARLHGDIAQALRGFWQSYVPKPSDIVLVAEDRAADRPLRGFCAIWCDGAPYLDNFHVLPDARGSGIGSALWAHALAELRSRGFNTLSLLVFESNASARAFYAKQGGTEVARFDTPLFGQSVPSIRVAWGDLAPAGARP